MTFPLSIGVTAIVGLNVESVAKVGRRSATCGGKEYLEGGVFTETIPFEGDVGNHRVGTAIGQGTWGEYTFKYGEGGRVASSKRTSPEFAGTIATTYAYDAKGTLKSETVVSDGEEGVTVHKNTYKHGRLVKTRAFEDGKLLVYRFEKEEA